MYTMHLTEIIYYLVYINAQSNELCKPSVYHEPIFICTKLTKYNLPFLKKLESVCLRLRYKPKSTFELTKH